MKKKIAASLPPARRPSKPIERRRPASAFDPCRTCYGENSRATPRGSVSSERCGRSCEQRGSVANSDEGIAMNTSTNPKRRILCPTILAVVLFVLGRTASAATVPVEVAPKGALVFSPVVVTIQPGDTVMWTWEASDHSVTSGNPSTPTGLFDSGIQKTGFTFTFTFPNPGTF